MISRLIFPYLTNNVLAFGNRYLVASVSDPGLHASQCIGQRGKPNPIVQRI